MLQEVGAEVVGFTSKRFTLAGQVSATGRVLNEDDPVKVVQKYHKDIIDKSRNCIKKRG